MASFLTTTQISAELENLIKSARDEITIISPYLKVNDRLQNFITDANQRRVRFILIYGKTDMKAAERAWINKLTTQETGFVPNLHAKCYLNESIAIVTSMNLYEFSQQNNDEMGILIRRDTEPELYQDIYAEAQRLGRTANLQWGEQDVAKRTAPSTSIESKRSPRPNRRVKTTGYCIRCGDPIDFDPKKPLCGKCYESWAQYKNESYQEKNCHKTGKSYATTFAKPLCPPCYTQHGRV